MSYSLIDEIDALIRRDPAARGLTASDNDGNRLCAGHLKEAAHDLVRSARNVAIITGFFIPEASPPAAETDGPPGAVVLAKALRAIGADAVLVTDCHCAPAVRAAADVADLDAPAIRICPHEAREPELTEQWIAAFFEVDDANPLTHLIAIERAGPSHNVESLQTQRRTGPVPLADFTATSCVETRNHCHNMCGERIDTWTAPLHQLFEKAKRHDPAIRTIGVGDGGNEIGMGAIPWEELKRRSTRPESAYTACRIATDWNIVAGTSNWGGFGLAAAVLSSAGLSRALSTMNEEFHRTMLERMVREGPAVDGVTRRQEPTVDGLAFDTYLEAWVGICRLLESAPT